MEVPKLNRCYRRSRIAAWKFRLLVRYFALDFAATDVAQLNGLTRRTVNTIFLKISERNFHPELFADRLPYGDILAPALARFTGTDDEYQIKLSLIRTLREQVYE